MIYFPELRDATREYNNSIVQFFQFLLASGFDPEIPVSAGTQALGHPKYMKHQEQMHLFRTALEHAIEKYADKYTKA